MSRYEKVLLMCAMCMMVLAVALTVTVYFHIIRGVAVVLALAAVVDVVILAHRTKK